MGTDQSLPEPSQAAEFDDRPYHGKTAVVVGAGPSGTTCALLLAEQGFNVKVFDKRPHPDDSVSINHRSIPITLNPKVTKTLTGLGLGVQDSGFLNGLHKAGPAGFISESGLRVGRATKGDCILGERHAIAFSLIKAAEHKRWKNLNFVFNSSCKGVDAGHKEVQFMSQQGPTTVPYDLLVGADGVNSVVRQTLEESVDGLEVEKIPVPARYISIRNIAPLETAKGLFGEAIAPGRLAFMPATAKELDGNSTPDSIVFYVTDNGKINGIVLGSIEKFANVKGRELEWLNQACPSSFPEEWKQPIADQVNQGTISVIGPILETSTLIGPSIALIGDAAHSLTPTFGLGANLAISDSIALGRAMKRADGDVDTGLQYFDDDWHPHVKSTMKLEKMSPSIESKGKNAIWGLFWGYYFRFHFITHTVGNFYLPWLIPQSVYRRHFASEITAPQAIKQFKLEAVLIMTILTGAILKLTMIILRYFRVLG